MAIFSMNNSIKSYAAFIEKLANQPEDDSITASLKSFHEIYIQYQYDSNTCAEVQWLSEKLTNSDENDALFSFQKIEQVWAYVHLILEHTVNKQFDIWNKGFQAADLPFYQEGLKKLWAKKHKSVMTIFCPDVDTSKHYIEQGGRI